MKPVIVGDIILYNIFYEIFSMCTSIVAESETGELIHGRNLDFGLFVGWDFQAMFWLLQTVWTFILESQQGKAPSSKFF